ncbi:MAG: GNAT family N-acyltransferase [Pseudomonadota bacterium]
MSAGKSRYAVQTAVSAQEIDGLQRFRAHCFGLKTARDADQFDEICTHIMINRRDSGQLVGCFRMLPLEQGEIARSYAAQFYELSALENFQGRLVELGRFCLHPAERDPDVLRLALAAMTAYVDEQDIAMLFGCSSFSGTETQQYLDAFAMLKARHLGPKRWLPRVKAPDVFRFAAQLRRRPDLKMAMRHMPPLLRTYLLMGGWVSDHAVVDQHMKTLHVFTGVEIGMIPPARRRLLRALVQSGPPGGVLQAR